MGTRQFKRVKDVLRHIEQSIKQWMHETYHRRIGASVQLLNTHQGGSRLTPKNSICRRAFDDKDLRLKCDTSDIAMKLISKAEGDEAAIGYRCHCGLSNIIIPHYDTLITRSNWYIFLGQFAIKPVDKCEECQMDHPCCPAHNDLLEDYDIIQLNGGSIESLGNDYRASIKEGLFSKPPKRLANDSLLDISQVLSCKTVATGFFGEEFSKVKHDSEIPNELRAFAKKYSVLPAEKKDKDEDNPLKPEAPLSQ